MMRTVSPGFAWFCSSCAYNFFICLTILPNFGCGTRVTVRTTIVLFMPLETTSPVRVLREPRVIDAGADCSSCSSAIVTSLQFVSRAVTTLFGSGQCPVVEGATCLVVPTGHSVAATGGEAVPDAS